MSCMLEYPEPNDVVDMTDTHISSDQLEREADEMLRRATTVLPGYGVRAKTTEQELERVKHAFAACGLVFFRAQGKDAAFVIPATVVEEAQALQLAALQQRQGIVDDGEDETPLDVIEQEMVQEMKAFAAEHEARHGARVKANLAHAVAEACGGA